MPQKRCELDELAASLAAREAALEEATLIMEEKNTAAKAAADQKEGAAPSQEREPPSGSSGGRGGVPGGVLDQPWAQPHRRRAVAMASVVRLQAIARGANARALLGPYLDARRAARGAG